MREYTFDIKVITTVRVRADNEAHARAYLNGDTLNGAEVLWNEDVGDLLDQMDGEPDLVEIDGEAV